MSVYLDVPDSFGLRKTKYLRLGHGVILWRSQYVFLNPKYISPSMNDAVKQAGLDNATHRRKTEFICGRTLLMHALKLAVPPGKCPSGAPDIPKGYGASLSHAKRDIVLITGPGKFLYGVDIEPLVGLSSFSAIVNRMATPDETQWLFRMDENRRLDAATLLFSAKETLFKMTSSMNTGCTSFKDFSSVSAPENGQWVFMIPNIGSNPVKIKVYFEYSDRKVITWGFHHRDVFLPCDG